MPLSDDILTAVQANLPALAANELKKFIEDAEQTKLESQQDKKRLLDTIELYKKLQSRNADLEDQKDAWIKLDEREKLIAKRESDAKLLETQYQLAEAKQRTIEIMRLVEIAFKSPVYRQQWSHSGNRGNSTNGGYDSMSGSNNQSEE